MCVLPTAVRGPVIITVTVLWADVCPDQGHNELRPLAIHGHSDSPSLILSLYIFHIVFLSLFSDQSLDQSTNNDSAMYHSQIHILDGIACE